MGKGLLHEGDSSTGFLFVSYVCVSLANITLTTSFDSFLLICKGIPSPQI